MSLKKKQPSAPCVIFNNGLKVPIIGLGTWKSNPGEVAQAVRDAIDAGYRHIDGAHVYGNENEVGEAVNAKISEGVVKRDDLFLTSKLWSNAHRPEDVRPALLTTLNNLDTPYLDLYLIHFPVALEAGKELMPADARGNIRFDDSADYLATWIELERAVDDGLVRSIGVSNFNRAQCERLLANCRIRPVTNQVECHPYLTQRKLGAYLREQGIVLTAYSPLGSPDRPFAVAGEPVLLEEQLLQTLAEKYKKSTAQILIRYQLERGHLVVPKSVTRSRIQSNFNVFDFRLDADDLSAIDGFERNGRLIEILKFKGSAYYPFNDEY